MEAYDLKYRCHDLIDEIVRLGQAKKTVYAYLAKRMGRTKSRMHFSMIDHIETLHTAQEELEQLLKRTKDAARRKLIAAQTKPHFRKSEKKIIGKGVIAPMVQVIQVKQSLAQRFKMAWRILIHG